MDYQRALADGHSPEDVMGELARRGVKMDYKRAIADGHDPMEVLKEMNGREGRGASKPTQPSRPAPSKPTTPTAPAARSNTWTNPLAPLAGAAREKWNRFKEHPVGETLHTLGQVAAEPVQLAGEAVTGIANGIAGVVRGAQASTAARKQGAPIRQQLAAAGNKLAETPYEPALGQSWTGQAIGHVVGDVTNKVSEDLNLPNLPKAVAAGGNLLGLAAIKPTVNLAKAAPRALAIETERGLPLTEKRARYQAAQKYNQLSQPITPEQAMTQTTDAAAAQQLNNRIMTGREDQATFTPGQQGMKRHGVNEMVRRSRSKDDLHAVRAELNDATLVAGAREQVDRAIPGEPGEGARTIRDRIKAESDTLAGKSNETARTADTQTAPLAATDSPQTAGERIADTLSGARKPLNEAKKAAYKEVDDLGYEMDFPKYRSKVEELVGSASTEADPMIQTISGVLKQTLEKARSTDGYDAIYKTINYYLRDSRFREGRGAALLQEAKNALKADAEDMGEAARKGDVAVSDGRIVRPSSVRQEIAGLEKRIAEEQGKQAGPDVDAMRTELQGAGAGGVMRVTGEKPADYAARLGKLYQSKFPGKEVPRVGDGGINAYRGDSVHADGVGDGSVGDMGQGIYFTDHPGSAEYFTDGTDKSHTRQFKINLKSPLDLTDRNVTKSPAWKKMMDSLPPDPEFGVKNRQNLTDWANGKLEVKNNYGFLARSFGQTPEAFNAFLAKHGYDGVVDQGVRGIADGGKQYVIFDKKQIGAGATPAAPTAEPITWKQFTGDRMSAYMKSEGGHAGAMKRISKEWSEHKGQPAAPVPATPTGPSASRITDLTARRDTLSRQLSEATPAEDFASKYQKATTLARQEAERYNRGAVEDVFKQGNQAGGGRYPHEKLPTKFATETGADDLARSLSDSTERDAKGKLVITDKGRKAAGALMKDHFAEQAARMVDNPKKLSAWVNSAKVKPVLQKLGLYDEFSNLSRAKQAVAESQATIDRFNKSTVGKLMDLDPDSIVGWIHKQPDPAVAMREVRAFGKGDKAYEAGLQVAVRDWVMNSGEVTAEDMLGFNKTSLSKSKKLAVARTKRMLREVFTGEQMDALSDFHETVRNVARNKTSPHGAQSATTYLTNRDMGQIGYGVARDVSRHFGGQIINSVANIVRHVVGKATEAHAERIEQFVDQAAFNPADAKILTDLIKQSQTKKGVTEATRGVLNARLRGYMKDIAVRGAGGAAVAGGTQPAPQEWGTPDNTEEPIE